MARTRLRHELLVSLSLLFGLSTVAVSLTTAWVLPRAESALQMGLEIAVLTTTQLVLLLVLSHLIVRRSLLDPVHKLVGDVRRIADGDYSHRVEPPNAEELRSIMESVNMMADRMIEDQEHLVGNVRSLEATNRELVEARNQVIQAARLVSVGTLAAGIAHEVGNPLGAIMGYVDVAASRARARGDDPELLDAIRGEAKRIDRIVRGLLDYARPKDDELRAHSPRDSILRVRDLLEVQGKLTQVESEWDVADDLPLILLQEQQLEQVLVNLLLNAIHAVEGTEQPKITISAVSERGPGGRLPARREDDHPEVNYLHRRRFADSEDVTAIATLKTAERIVVVSVFDNGPGLSDEALERIFDPFYTTKDPGEGTGLGLFISSRLVEGMGGRIEVENCADAGARFTLLFPEALGVHSNENQES